MSVYQRARGIHWFNFMVGGSRFQGSIDTRDMRQARKIEGEEKRWRKEELRQLRDKAREMDCKPADLAQCFYCEMTFSQAIAVTVDRHQFCSETCSQLWSQQNKQAPTLRELSQRFLDNAAVGRRLLKIPEESVIHSLRHAMLTHLGAAGADALTIKKMAGHSSIRISQKYMHPTPETIELHFQRFEDRAAKQLALATTKVTTISLRGRERRKRLPV